ncbi:MAG: cyclopropane-fatty-acyl-phospholipid synthase family protein [Thermoleophilaceae bacterium]
MSARRIVTALLRRVRRGEIVVVEDGRRESFGDPGADLRATVHVHDRGVWRSVLRGSTGLAESYAAGRWDCDDVLALIRIAARNVRGLDRLRERFAWLLRPGQRLVPRNTRRGSRRNIAAHYDLGNDLFSLFLDETMTYSCAVFEAPGMTLEQAQRAKLDRICERLELGPDDHLLEIGTGWGGLAIHAARTTGCRVTTTTISREQHDFARARVRAAGLEDRIELLLEDYRDIDGRYDKLVSIEMIEAVGWQYLDAYFEHCSGLLTPDGLMLLQAITIDDRAFHVEKASRSFANTMVFPGGCLPSVEALARSVAGTDLRMTWLEDIGPDYAETIAHWAERFESNAAQAAELGYDDRFRRLWRLYLAYTEAGFREGRIGDVQLLLAKPGRLGTRAEQEAPALSLAASG